MMMQNVTLILSVPSIRGKPLQCHSCYGIVAQALSFQSPPFGASHCNIIRKVPCEFDDDLSVPSIRGKPLQWYGDRGGIRRHLTFSPLHSGQATAIFSSRRRTPGTSPLSVPSIRGKPLQSGGYPRSTTHSAP